MLWFIIIMLPIQAIATTPSAHDALVVWRGNDQALAAILF
jgi:hypothetical protein